MSFLYHEILFRPLLNLLILFYNIIPGGDFGIAIILLTLAIRVAFFPLTVKSLVSQHDMNRIQPKLKELQEKHKHDKQALGKATMELYKEHNINPLSGCLPLLIQLPVLIALYSALRSGLKPESLTNLYSFIHNPSTINNIALGFIDLTKKNYIMAILAGVLQWFQLKQASKAQAPESKNEPPSTALQMNRQMLYFFPVMVIIIAWNLPAGLTLYWVAATGFSLLEQLYITKKYKKHPVTPTSQ